MFRPSSPKPYSLLLLQPYANYRSESGRTGESQLGPNCSQTHGRVTESTLAIYSIGKRHNLTLSTAKHCS